MSNEAVIYGVPESDLVKEPKQLEKGTYYNFNTYNLYVPNNVNASTSAFIYYPGSGGSGNDGKIIENIIDTGQADQIIVIADDAYRDRKTNGSGHLQLIENIGASNGVEINNVNMMGFSAGGPATYGTLINTIQNYPDSGPHNAVFCDVVDFNVTQEQIDLLKQDNSTLLFFEPNKQITKFEKDLAKAGVDVIICRTYGPHAGHTTVNKEALANGIIDFASGKTDTLANSDIYTFQEYDSETGEFRNISIEEVAQKFNVSMSGADPIYLNERLSNISELRSENEYLASKVNNIRSSVRNTNFLSAGTSDSYSSTTLVPSSLGVLVQSYFSTCSCLLNKIEVDTRMIIEIGESIDRMNKDLEKESEELNQSMDVYNGMTNEGNTNSSNNDLNTQNSYANSIGSGNYDDEYETIEDFVIREDVEVLESDNRLEEFYDYDKLYSNDKYLVYKTSNIGDNCKILVHYDNNKVTGLEYYFDFKTKGLAASNVDILAKSFKKSDRVVQKDEYVKVVFKDDIYSHLTLDTLKINFSKFDEIVK